MESKTITLESEHDISIARHEVRLLAGALGFRSIDQTRLATITSELARNIVKYAERGSLIAQQATGGVREGLRLVFEDNGPRHSRY